MRKFPLLLLGCLGLVPFSGFSQQFNNLRKKAIIVASRDTVTLDTLSIIPGSFSISYKKQKLDTTYYTLDPAHARIILNRAALTGAGIKPDTIFCAYKTFPLLFTKTIEHKDNSVVHPTTYNQQQAYTYQVGGNGRGVNDPFDLGTLSKSGSISRGVTFGNNQNLTVNSSLNLQLAGKLSNNVNVLVAATDNNLPIQAEGNTQQLQDFDKVFVKLYNQNTSLIAGDFELQSPNDYFMKFYKKSEGGLFSTRAILKPNKDSTKAGILKVSLGGGISKGKYANDQIQAIDGNLGPYLLTGSDNENYIVILSGTEKVYLDGQLMLRGQNNDYVIDYNSAQVTFTPKHLITQQSRITVEFQYSDQSFLRSLMYENTEYRDNKMNLHLNFYSEQDAKNQPLSQSLSSEQEQFLASIGNNIQNALVPGATGAAYNSNQVFYRKADTIVGAVNDSVFVYCTDSIISPVVFPNSLTTHFIVNFSQVAQGQGDYVQVASAANGRVFKWVVPVAGVHQGNYIAEVLLITPKKKQMATFGGDYKISPSTSIIAQTAISNNDINTFSNFDKSNDVGYAGKFSVHNVTYVQDTATHKANALKLTTDLGYEGVQKDFSPIERYRSIEFARDWNRTSDSVYQNQNILSGTVTLGNKKDMLGYGFQEFLEGTNYTGTKHDVQLRMSEGKTSISFIGSLLNTQTMNSTSNYYKELGNISYKLFHWVIGGGESTEKDIFRSRKSDSIITTSSDLFQQANTFQYFQWNTSIHSADTSKVSYGVNYQERTDYAPKDNDLHKSLYSKNISFDINFLKNPKSRFKANVTYHVLTILDTMLAAGQQPVNALMGQAEYDLNALKGFLFSSTFYQAGSGLQQKETYTYVQVAQGQGVYAWTDFNHDGIQELNEFYVAPFPDEADYIRVYTPTNQFIKTYNSGVTETFNLRPAALWASQKTGIKSFIARFSEQLSLHIDRKTTSSDPTQAYNPFLQKPGDTNLVGLNSTIRNTVFFNQLNPSFGADYTYSDNQNKTILQETGEQDRETTYQDFHVRYNFTTKWMLEGEEKFGNDFSSSAYFATNDFNIMFYQTQPRLSFQPNTSFRTTLLFIYTTKQNAQSLGGGSSVQQNYGVELKYNVLKKGSLSVTGNYVNITFSGGESDSPLGFEMLQGLSVGNNYTWSISYQCNISENIQLNISYNGRESANLPIVNTANAQVRAFF